MPSRDKSTTPKCLLNGIFNLDRCDKVIVTHDTGPHDGGLIAKCVFRRRDGRNIRDRTKGAVRSALHRKVRLRIECIVEHKSDATRRAVDINATGIRIVELECALIENALLVRNGNLMEAPRNTDEA